MLIGIKIIITILKIRFKTNSLENFLKNKNNIRNKKLLKTLMKSFPIMNNILITGGAGFIGSHICTILLEENYNVYIVDNFSNSSKKVFDSIKKIMQNDKNFDDKRLNIFDGDIRDEKFLNAVFSNAKKNNKPIDSVIHCAGLKAVKDSILNPLSYWDTNVCGSINLLKVMEKNQCSIILFSSSATVYGNSDNIPFKETATLCPINPYGETKLTIELILENLVESYNSNWNVGYLRYFNPIGAHHSGLIGENPTKEPENIFPRICQVAAGLKEKLYIYGKDWPTEDGTCCRDYIHIVDLAIAHKKAIEYLLENTSSKLILNVGTGKSNSILGLIKTFEQVNNIKINYEFADRREGDTAESLADTNRALKILNWEPQKTIEDMCRDGWRWQKNIKNF